MGVSIVRTILAILGYPDFGKLPHLGLGFRAVGFRAVRFRV